MSAYLNNIDEVFSATPSEVKNQLKLLEEKKRKKIYDDKRVCAKYGYTYSPIENLDLDYQGKF
tara:strand:+ start:1439 stop:1627 length:189 start_codon:yes stop_codon:yes gene_type:complete